MHKELSDKTRAGFVWMFCSLLNKWDMKLKELNTCSSCRRQFLVTLTLSSDYEIRARFNFMIRKLFNFDFTAWKWLFSLHTRTAAISLHLVFVCPNIKWQVNKFLFLKQRLTKMYDWEYLLKFFFWESIVFGRRWFLTYVSNACK